MSHIKKEHVKIVPGSKMPTVEVSGGEDYVDACAAVATQAKQATVLWEDTKRTLRGLATEARNVAEDDGEAVGNVHILGNNGNFMEVIATARRKDLKGDVVENLDPGLLPLLHEDIEVTLTGSAAIWISEVLKSQHFPKDEVTVKRHVQLTPAFEARRRKARVAGDPLLGVLDALGEAGCFAPAVEAKKK